MLFCGAAFSADYSIIRQYVKVALVTQGATEKTAVVKGSGSAVVIAPTYAVTAAHNVPTDPTQSLSIMVDGHVSVLKVLKVDRIVDIALVSSPEIKCPCAPFATSVNRDEEAWTVGFPKFMSYQTQFVTMGTLQGMLNGRIVATPTAAPGSSGGGMFVKRGTDYQFAGLIVAIGSSPMGPTQLMLDQETQWITFSVPASTIKAFLKGTAGELK
jgi:S1-C subfamily serine protease